LADEDLQFWFPTQIIHPLTEDLTASMQVEGRFREDISKFSQMVLKPALNYHFDEHWGLSGGYKFIEKYEDPNEHDPWQELIFSDQHGDLVTKFQVRLEQRLIAGMNGILPRIRLLGHVAHPIGDTPYYLTSWGAVRFNLADKGEGPVSGFEQVRGFAGLGHYLNKHTQVELGYLYRYERERSGSNPSDHVIHLQVVIHTGGKNGLKPHPRDQYR
jgi:hypothetical protein